MKEIISEIYKKKFSNKLNKLFKEKRWDVAKLLLEKELSKFSQEYFLITSLAKVCYNLKDFRESLKYAQKAIKIESNDVLVIYDYGCALSGINEENKALEQWNKILEKNINDIAYDDFGEGLKWAKSIYNDTIYRKAMSLYELGYNNESLDLINEHLEKRKRGIYSDFSKAQILKKKQTIIPMKQFVIQTLQVK